MATTARAVTRPPVDAPVPELVDLVRGVLHASLRRLDPVLEAEGITMGQFWTLKTIAGHDAASVGSIARNLGVSAPTACATLDPLETAGLIVRSRSDRDRRTVRLSLTTRGRRVEAKVWAAIAAVMADAAAGLPSSDLATTVRVFRELHRRLDREAS